MSDPGPRAPAGPPQSGSATGRPAVVELTGVAGITAVQGVALVAVGVLLLAKTVSHPPDRPVFAVVGALLAAMTGVVVAWLGNLVRRCRGGARTPLVVLELLALPVAWGLAQSGLWPYALGLGGPPLVLLYLLATPAGRAPFVGR